MNNQKNLHISRIRGALQAVDGFLNSDVNVKDPNFKHWKDLVNHSLVELFGQDNSYPKRFSSLQFYKPRMRVNLSSSSHQSQWSQEDQTIFNEALQRAKNLLEDALEEVGLIPEVEPVLTSPSRPPQIVVNVQNVLSQTTHVDINQVLTNLSTLGMPADQLSQAQKHAQDLSNESKGEQRWPVLAKSLDALKSMGKSVYENVAIPIILEMLKKQAGLSN